MGEADRPEAMNSQRFLRLFLGICGARDNNLRLGPAADVGPDQQIRLCATAD
jgi:hypothetical protein